MDLLTGLSLASVAGGVISAIFYVRAFILHRRANRLASTIGLCATTMVLFQLPLFLRGGAQGENFINGAAAVVMALIAATAQIVEACRERRDERP